MKIKNISASKIIGIGDVTVLPGETKDIPPEYEKNPVLSVYQKMGFAKILSEHSEKTQEDAHEDHGKDSNEENVQEVAREQALAALNAMKPTALTEDDQQYLATCAMAYGVNPADCKSQADLLKKLKAMLKK